MKYYALVCCVALSSVASIGMPIGANAAPIGCSAVAGTVMANQELIGHQRPSTRKWFERSLLQSQHPLRQQR